MHTSLDDLPQRIQDAVRAALPDGVSDFDSFINMPWHALGNRSIALAFQEDGPAAEDSIIEACVALKQMRPRASPVISLA